MTSQTKQIITKQTPITLGLVLSIAGVAVWAGVAFEKAVNANKRASENRESIGRLEADRADMKAVLGKIEGYMQRMAEDKIP